MSVARPVQRLPIALAYLGFVFVGVSAGVGGVLLPAQIGDYRVDKATIGVTFFAFSAGYLLAGGAAGWLVHRFGSRMALVIGGGAVTLAGAYIATRAPFPAFVSVQLALGFGIGVLESVLNVYLSALPDATTLLNRLHGFFGVGALIGPAMAAYLLRGWPWTVVWLVLTVASGALVIGFFLSYPPGGLAGGDQAAARDAPAPDPPVRASSGRTGQTGRTLLGAAVRTPAVLLGALFLAVYVGLESSVGNWGFSFVTGEYRQQAVLAGYTISGYWFGLTVGRFVISPIAKRVGLSPSGTSFVCLAGVTLCAVLIWLVPVVAVVVVFLVLLGFFLGPLFPTAMALVPVVTSARLVPTAIGVMNGVSLIGGAALPWLAGVLAQGAGLWTLFPFVVVLALWQAAIWWRLTRE